MTLKIESVKWIRKFGKMNLRSLWNLNQKLDFFFDLPKELSKSTVRPRGEFPIALAEVLDG